MLENFAFEVGDLRKNTLSGSSFLTLNIDSHNTRLVPELLLLESTKRFTLFSTTASARTTPFCHTNGYLRYYTEIAATQVNQRHFRCGSKDSSINFNQGP